MSILLAAGGDGFSWGPRDGCLPEAHTAKTVKPRGAGLPHRQLQSWGGAQRRPGVQPPPPASVGDVGTLKIMPQPDVQECPGISGSFSLWHKPLGEVGLFQILRCPHLSAGLWCAGSYSHRSGQRKVVCQSPAIHFQVKENKGESGNGGK